MIVCSDPDYHETKLIKQGLKPIAPSFQELASWINSSFNTKVLNIYYDRVETDKNMPRLSIIFEYPGEADKFKDKDGNFDEARQVLIGNKFKELQGGQFRNYKFFKRFFGSRKFNTDRLLVIFAAFEPLARAEVNQLIPEHAINELKSQIAMKDLWEIYRQYSLTTFFFYTEQQLERYSSDGTTEFLKQKYFSLLKLYDEFDYIKPDTFFIKYDSKENFDRNYESNWFYYSR